MEKARAKEHAKNLAFSKKGATQILTKASSTIAALQAMVGRSDIDLIAPHWLFAATSESMHPWWLCLVLQHTACWRLCRFVPLAAWSLAPLAATTTVYGF